MVIITLFITSSFLENKVRISAYDQTAAKVELDATTNAYFGLSVAAIVSYFV